MIKDVVDAMNAGVFAQIGLIAFFVAFILIILYVVTLPKMKREHAKQIPLEDDEVNPTLN
jgi:cbb3-type cytochrome oxidase subunit 3